MTVRLFCPSLNKSFNAYRVDSNNFGINEPYKFTLCLAAQATDGLVVGDKAEIKFSDADQQAVFYGLIASLMVSKDEIWLELIDPLLMLKHSKSENAAIISQATTYQALTTLLENKNLSLNFAGPSRLINFAYYQPEHDYQLFRALVADAKLAFYHHANGHNSKLWISANGEDFPGFNEQCVAELSQAHQQIMPQRSVVIVKQYPHYLIVTSKQLHWPPASKVVLANQTYRVLSVNYHFKQTIKVTVKLVACHHFADHFICQQKITSRQHFLASVAALAKKDKTCNTIKITTNNGEQFALLDQLSPMSENNLGWHFPYQLKQTVLVTWFANQKSALSLGPLNWSTQSKQQLTSHLNHGFTVDEQRQTIALTSANQAVWSFNQQGLTQQHDKLSIQTAKSIHARCNVIAENFQQQYDCQASQLQWRANNIAIKRASKQLMTFLSACINSHHHQANIKSKNSDWQAAQRITWQAETDLIIQSGQNRLSTKNAALTAKQVIVLSTPLAKITLNQHGELSIKAKQIKLIGLNGQQQATQHLFRFN